LSKLKKWSGAPNPAGGRDVEISRLADIEKAAVWCCVEYGSRGVVCIHDPHKQRRSPLPKARSAYLDWIVAPAELGEKRAGAVSSSCHGGFDGHRFSFMIIGNGAHVFVSGQRIG